MKFKISTLSMLPASQKHGLKTMSLKQIQITNFQITKELIMKEKPTKEGLKVFMYIRNDLTYKIRNDLCISYGDKEMMAKSMKNIIVSCYYKPPDGNWKNHCDHLQEILTNDIMENKLYFVTGDFNLNCLEFHQSSEIRQFFNNMFEKGAIPLINRPTIVTTSSATLPSKKGKLKLLFQTASQYFQRLNFQMKKLKTEK